VKGGIFILQLLAAIFSAMPKLLAVQHL